MQIFGPEEIKQRVLDQGLCTVCGACADLCPYFRAHKGKISSLFECDRSQGRCYAHCPKIGVDFDKLSTHYFSRPYKESPLGVYTKILAAKRGSKAPEGNFQNGGTVSSLLAFALEQKQIDAALVTGRKGIFPEPKLVNTVSGILENATAKYMASPTVTCLNQAKDKGFNAIGVVGTPCQMTAVAQLRLNPLEKSDFKDITALTIGLFCTWAIDTQDFERYLKKKAIDINSIRSMDIPPPPAETFILTLENQVKEFPLSEIRELVLNGCGICPDMTSEWSDLSVGALEGQPGWNTLIIRTGKGEALVDAAVQAGFLETDEVPEANIANLTLAAGNKKKRARERCQALGMTQEALEAPAEKKKKQTIMGFR